MVAAREKPGRMDMGEPWVVCHAEKKRYLFPSTRMRYEMSTTVAVAVQVHVKRRLLVAPQSPVVHHLPDEELHELHVLHVEHPVAVGVPEEVVKVHAVVANEPHHVGQAPPVLRLRCIHARTHARTHARAAALPEASLDLVGVVLHRLGDPAGTPRRQRALASSSGAGRTTCPRWTSTKGRAWLPPLLLLERSSRRRIPGSSRR